MMAETFLSAILDELGEDAPRLAFADWLDTQGQCDQGAFIRVQCALARQSQKDEVWLDPSPHLGRLSSIDDFRNDIGPKGIAALSRCPALNSLMFQRLKENRIGDEGVRFFAGSPICRKLKHLDLSSNAIGEVGVKALADSPFLSSLASLRLENNDFSTSVIEALEASPHLSTLQKLELGARDDDKLSNSVFQRLTKRLGSDFDNAWDEEE
jgi:uncharacterized protein (TIGR02996 family)